MAIWTPKLIKPPLGTPICKGHPLARSLRGYWPMNEGSGSTVYDLSGNRCNGTFVQTVGWVAGHRGPATWYDGSGDYINIGEPTALDQDFAQITIAASIYIPDDTGQRAILGKYANWYFATNGNADLRLRHSEVGDGTTEVNPGFVSGNWYDVAVTYDGSAVRFYVDGRYIGGETGLSGTLGTNDYGIAIGNYAAGIGWSYKGNMDYVAMWSRALTASEIADLYADPFQMFESPGTTAIFSGFAGGGEAHGIEGTSAGTSSTTGAVSIALSIAGQSDGSCITTGATSMAWSVAGQSDGAASTAGDLTLTKFIAGQSDGSCTTTGATSIAWSVAGQSDGAASIAGAVSIALSIAGQSDGVSTTTGAATIAKLVAGQVDGASSATGAAIVAYMVAGQADGAATVTGILTLAEVWIAGQSDGVSSVTGAVSIARLITGQADGTSTFTGAASVARLIAGQSDGIASVTGAIVVAYGATGESGGVGSVTGTVSVARLIAGQSDGVSSVTGTLIAEGVFIAGTAAGVSTVTGRIRVPEWDIVLTENSSDASPVFAGLDLTGITDGNIPYVSAAGFANSPLITNGTTKLTLDQNTFFGLGAEADQYTRLHLVSNASYNILGIDSYNGGATTQCGYISIRRSNNDTIGTLTTTVNNQYLGQIRWQGVDSGGGFDNGAYFNAIQDGAAGTKVPTKLILGVSSSTATNAAAFVLRHDSVGINEALAVTQFEMTGTAPYFTLHNSTYEDSDGGRESRIIARGEQSGEEETILGYMEFSHDGAADDQNGMLRVYVNDGNDGTSPTLRTKWGYDGSLYHGDGGVTNYSKFEADGTLEFNGAATVWNDANLGVAQLALPVAGQPDEDEFVDEVGSDTGISTWAFAIGEKVSGSIEIPHDYKEGSDITFHVHWQGIAAPSETDYVKWQCTYTVAQVNETLDAVSTTVGETAIDTQYDFKRTDCTAITGTNFNIGDQFLFTLERIAAAGDAYAGDALVATVGFHYECDTVGSRQINTK